LDLVFTASDGMELSKLSSSILPEGSGDEWQESGPLGRKGEAPNREEAGVARESTATNDSN
jgi:hypothetical protein